MDPRFLTGRLLVGLSIVVLLGGCASPVTSLPSSATPTVTATPSAGVATPTPTIRTPSPTVAPTATSAPTPAASPIGPMTTARESPTATLLRDGRVLVVGGSAMDEGANSHPLASAEIYDPKTGRFSRTGSMATPRSGHIATLLRDGRVLVAGGTKTVYGWSEEPFVPFASAEIYDPKTGKFKPTGSMAHARIGPTSTLLRDGRVLITGGSTYSGGSSDFPLARAEIYDPKTGTFRPTGRMKVARYRHTATLLADGRVLVAGGLKLGGADWPALATAEIYDPEAGTFSPTGSMTTARSRHTATLLADGSVLFAGGADKDAKPVAKAELYDPKTGTFRPTGSMSGAGVEGYTATLLADGRVLIIRGGSSAEVYDPKSGTFSRTGSMACVSWGGHTATLLADGHVLVAGGCSMYSDDGPVEAEIYDPGTGTFSARKP